MQIMYKHLHNTVKCSKKDFEWLLFDNTHTKIIVYGPKS